VSLFRLLPRAIAPAVLLVAVGCSGSDYNEVMITEQNAQMIASEGMGAADTLESMSDLVESFSNVFDQPPPQTILCDAGEVIVSLNDMAPAGLSTGDYANFDFNGCVMDIDGLNLSLNGMMYFSVVEVTGAAPGPFTATLSASFGSMTVGILGAMVIVQGGFTLELSSADGETFTSVVSGSEFSAFAQAGNQTFSGSLSNFRLERTYNTATGAYLVDLDATVYSSELGGTAVFETTVPFQGTDPNHPDTGEFVATGAEGATVTVVALNNTTVEIRIDADWDGMDETTVQTPWDTLDA
jgi:hypothetical protein